MTLDHNLQYRIIIPVRGRIECKKKRILKCDDFVDQWKFSQLEIIENFSGTMNSWVLQLLKFNVETRLIIKSNCCTLHPR